MRIDDWGIGRIMQLPDCCFGQRWPVGVAIKGDAKKVYYDISEAALPEMCVVWALIIAQGLHGTVLIEINLALGDVLPTNNAEFDAMEPLLRDIGPLVAGRRQFWSGRLPSNLLIPMRRFIATGGRRLVGRFDWDSANTSAPTAILVVSAVPTEVPDWLISGSGRSPS